MKESDPVLSLQDPVKGVPGVGPRRAAALADAGVVTVDDLLLHLPIRYEDRRQVRRIADLVPGQVSSVEGIVIRRRRTGQRRRSRLEAVIEDDSGRLAVVWFHQPYLASRFEDATRIRLYGTPREYRGALQMVNPALDVADDALEDCSPCGRIVPVYRRIGQLGSGLLEKLVNAALDRVEDLPEALPGSVVRDLGLVSRAQALRQVHAPTREVAALTSGRSDSHRRLALEEFLEFQLALRTRDDAVGRATPGIAHPEEACDPEMLAGNLPFTMTPGQRRALGVILGDMARSTPMHRLLQGDVGCGKTAVAGCALLVSALGGRQGVLLAPTGILAVQHFRTLSAWFSNHELEVACLTASTPAGERRRVLRGVANGAIPVLVGTHAVLEPRVELARLGIAVVDEQHRFGVGQRAALRAKGEREGVSPDLLVMTATPIPRSLALTVYGDLDVTSIRDTPPGRAPVDTVLHEDPSRGSLVRRIGDAVAAGGQVFVVAPRIDASDDNVHAVVDLFDDVAKSLPDARVGLVHGDLDSIEREHAMEQFVDGGYDVLVATTVVEVGVDVARATLIVIENAERFGLAQLHQLRGRVGRGERRSTCVLVARSPITATARERLRSIAAMRDGFRIAEEDLRLRGPGEMLGRRQSGAFGLRVGDPFQDHDWLQEARGVADELSGSKDLEAVSYLESVRERWARRTGWARAG